MRSSPSLSSDPARVSVALLDRLVGQYAEQPAWPYLLAYLAACPEATAAVRAVAQADLADQLPLGETIRRRLARAGTRVVIVQDVAETTDDQIGPARSLLRAFLSASPTVEVTLVTTDPELYRHPHLTVVGVGEPDLPRLLETEPDVLVHLVVGGVDERGHGADLATRIDAQLAESPPLLFVRGSFGPGGLSFPSLAIEGREYAAALGLDRRGLSAAHATLRLLAHLGLPTRPREALDGQDLMTDRPTPSSDGQSAPPDPLWLELLDDLQAARPSAIPSSVPPVLILTPIKDAANYFDRYLAQLATLTYPHRAISLGFLEGDSSDGTYDLVRDRLPALRAAFRRAGLWKRDFAYRPPTGVHRGAESIQIERRIVLARSRNHLLSHALDDEVWVLWLDVDVIEYPPDLIEQLLAAGKELVQPHCVLDPGGPTFDTNGWRDRGRLHLDDLRTEGALVELDAVGATVLLVKADLHRDGLVFPPFLYGRESPWMRPGRGEVETEGLGMMARDMGHRAWGLPFLEVRHGRW